MAERESSPARRARTGKVAAVITVVMISATVVVLVAVLISFRNNVPIQLESVVESVDASDGCEWRLTIELRNNTDQDLTIERIGAILNRGRKNGMIEQAPILAPDEIGVYLVAFRLPSQDGCPAVDEINHGNLIFHLEDGSSQSVRF